jgi:peroxiredoxin
MRNQLHTLVLTTLSLTAVSGLGCEGRLSTTGAPEIAAPSQPTTPEAQTPTAPVLDGDAPLEASMGPTMGPLPSEGLCPPTGATDGEAGQISPDFSLPTDDGGTFSVRASCDRPVVIWRFSENCGICRRVLRDDVNELAGQVRAIGGVFVVVFSTALTVDGATTIATLEDARRIRAEYAIDAQILVAVDVGATQNLFYRQGSRYVLALRRGNVLAARYGRIEEPDLRALITSMQSSGI